MTRSAPAALRALFEQEEMVIAPGAIDGITARLVEQAGFPAVYMTGAGASATLGYPDYGLLTMSEMVASAARIAAAVSIPLISDADTGYGNELNVFRAVREFEAAGAAAIHIEDQVFPKRCGHLDNKEVVGREDYLSKIRAAVSARREGLVIIARTDSRATTGFDEAIERANLALAAGADMAFVEALQTPEEVALAPRRVNGPCLLNVVMGGKTPEMSMQEAQGLGYALAIVPVLLLAGMVDACDRLLGELKRDGRHPAVSPHSDSPAKLFARLGAADWDDRRTAFRDTSGPSKE